jgi:hypothetical protein
MKIKIKDILIFYIGIVFILASFHRIYLISQREKEAYEVFKLPKYFDIIIIIFEFLIGFLLLINFKYKLFLLYILIIFLIIWTIILICLNIDKLLYTYNDLFTFQPTSMSLVLHITYIVIIFAILFDDVKIR